MKYCYFCNRITPGEPFFCNYCGRSYDARFCPKKHRNPRGAVVCSECGSRDLSQPQPKVPAWAFLLQWLLCLVPGGLLAFVSIGFIAAFLYDLHQNPQHAIALALLVGVLWWLWFQLPRWLREFVYRLLKRRRDGEGRNG